MDGKKLLKNLLIDDEVLEVLSEVGVYIANYRNREFLSSNVWKSVPDKFYLDFKDTDFLNHIHPEDRERIGRALDAVINGRERVLHEIYRLEHNEGGYRWIYTSGRSVGIDKEGKTILFVGADRDITELKEKEETLQRSIAGEKERSRELEILRQISSAANSTMDRDELIRLTLEETRRIIPFDFGTVQILEAGELRVIGAEGFSNPDEVTSLCFPYPEKGSLSTRALQEGKPFLSTSVTRDFPAFVQPSEDVSIHSWMGIPLISRGALIGLMALDGRRKEQFCAHHLELAQIVGDQMAMALERSILHEKAYAMAMTDSLTGLGSRHRLEMEGRLLIETALRNRTEMTLAVLDIDHFKRVNDRYGHDTGDIILRRIADCCGADIRAVDSLCRFGGEEFVLILPDTDSLGAEIVLERIRSSVEALEHPEIEGKVTISVGYCSAVAERSENYEHFLARADKALYASKENGRNRVSDYNKLKRVEDRE